MLDSFVGSKFIHANDSAESIVIVDRTSSRLTIALNSSSGMQFIGIISSSTSSGYIIADSFPYDGPAVHGTDYCLSLFNISDESITAVENIYISGT